MIAELSAHKGDIRMRNTLEQLDHALDIFRTAGRHDLIIGLTPADWDALCALVADRPAVEHDDPGLTRNSYRGVPIVSLAANDRSFVGHDHDGPAERRFPLNVLMPMEVVSV